MSGPGFGTDHLEGHVPSQRLADAAFGIQRFVPAHVIHQAPAVVAIDPGQVGAALGIDDVHHDPRARGQQVAQRGGAEVHRDVVAFGERALHRNLQRLARAAGGTVAGDQVAAAHPRGLPAPDLRRLHGDALRVLREAGDFPAIGHAGLRVAVQMVAHDRLEHHAWTPDAALGRHLVERRAKAVIGRALEAGQLMAQHAGHEAHVARNVGGKARVANGIRKTPAPHVLHGAGIDRFAGREIGNRGGFLDQQAAHPAPSQFVAQGQADRARADDDHRHARFVACLEDGPRWFSHAVSPSSVGAHDVPCGFAIAPAPQEFVRVHRKPYGVGGIGR